MHPFLSETFLLPTTPARALFAATKNTPIFDWHCHLSPREIYENKTPQHIAELWLGGDHYKWRAMRSCGVPEHLITGDSAPAEKFRAWAACMPRLIGNPLYHWAHLELQRFFGRASILEERSAAETWADCNAQIANGGFTPQELITKSNVTHLCTTDDPADTLEYHHALAQEKKLPFRVLPAFRPDNALALNGAAFLPWLARLEQVIGQPIKSFHALCHALCARIAFFDSLGCRAADHGLPYIPYAPVSADVLERIFQARLRSEPPAPLELEQYQTVLLQKLAAEYHARGWVMELHIGPMRNNNTRQFQTLGPDTGFDSIGDWPMAQPLSRFLDSLDQIGQLPKTILFNLNPRDTYILGTMLGNFQSEEARGKLQLGPAWWFLDHIDGMCGQLRTLGNLGALGTFIGMATDSRSFLSYPRHEYFRRIFCGLVGGWAEDGLVSWDKNALAALTRDVFYDNAVGYFGV
jgi:glucuronate isomerase